jgi:CubicO group peptidase (beta-lactamase class C family)
MFARRLLRCLRYWALTVVLLAQTVTMVSADAAAPDVPRLTGITVDGDSADWADRGFRVEVLPNDQGALRPPQDLDAQLRLGWNDDGLLALITVLDNTPVESPGSETLYTGDSVELFISAALSSSAHYQYIVAPGRDPATPQSRMKLYDYRLDKTKEPTVTIVTAKTADGYTVEAVFPWRNLDLTPEVGMEMAFMVFVNDYDAPGNGFQAIWYPRDREGAGSRTTHPIRLSDSAGPPVLMVARGSFERMRRTRVDVAAVERLAGRSVELRDGDTVLDSAQLSAENGRATADPIGPLPPEQGFRDLFVRVDDTTTAAVSLPDLGRERARSLLEIPVNFHPYLVSSPEFPPCDFDQPSLVEDLIGRYTLNTTFYDADYSPVTRAEKPGRYGAVVEVIPERGRGLTLFRTLFRLPQDPGMAFWWPRNVPLRVELPPAPWINSAIAAEQSGAVNDIFWGSFLASTDRDATSAALMAGLYEGNPTGSRATIQDDLLAQDRQWWVGLKRKLYGMESKYPAPFVCPRPVEGPLAPVLHEGAAAQAGMKPDGVAELEVLLQEWGANTDEGFQVCVARRGVIVINKAYGPRDGRPMTLTDRSWMASITKLLSATLMMTLVDQGRVSLDDPVEQFLPAFRGAAVKTPLTIRHLYTHTNGLWDHWGDELNDFDQLIGSYYPYLSIGKSFSYNGAGYALGGKVIEVVSGEALPLFYKRHLLDSLGCENTEVFGTSWDARSTALDIAKVGQLLLNKGAYGNMRFFGEATFQQMLPERLTKVLGPDTAVERGIGLHSFDGEPLSKATFGHGAASSATLRIDPVNDLVVVMTRNQAGAGFDAYHARFLKAVVDAIAD